MPKNPGLKAPFPYFGGKASVAETVWRHLGDVDKFIEPFCGSAAVLLARPWDDKGSGRYKELINDKAHFVANFWRALKADPERVAWYCDTPIIEADLHARQLWLIGEGVELLKQCEFDESFYDAKAAGYWAWGASCWIGSNWATDGRHAKPNMTPRGVNRLTHDEWDADGFYYPVNVSLREYLGEISRRLRQVRVLSGDWERTVKPSEVNVKGTVGVFLDPPYLEEKRDGGLYYHEGSMNDQIVHWCMMNQETVRIVLAGYEGEYDLPGWKVVPWKAKRAFASSKTDSRNVTNRHLERLWLSPSCLNLDEILDDPEEPVPYLGHEQEQGLQDDEAHRPRD
jgi:DNA adenine methylase